MVAVTSKSNHRSSRVARICDKSRRKVIEVSDLKISQGCQNIAWVLQFKNFLLLKEWQFLLKVIQGCHFLSFKTLFFRILSRFKGFSQMTFKVTQGCQLFLSSTFYDLWHVIIIGKMFKLKVNQGCHIFLSSALIFDK